MFCVVVVFWMGASTVVWLCESCDLSWRGLVAGVVVWVWDVLVWVGGGRCVKSSVGAGDGS